MQSIRQSNELAPQVLESRLEKSQLLNQLIQVYTHNIIDTAHKARSGMVIWKDAKTKLEHGKTRALDFWAQLERTANNEQEIEQIQATKPLFSESIKAIETLQQHVADESAYSLGNFVDLNLYTSLDPLLISLDKIVLLEKEIASQEIEQNSNQLEFQNLIFIIIIFIVVIVVIIFGLSIFRSIEKPLSHLLETMTQIEI
ncbi:hypothetical protein [Aliikangiella maris]|uniref:Methyl-accepting chemotaxis protein n=2 Tax=Aliikangiella maris TaxID=3162458 RepID=A0ABV2BWS7_9GAMM